VPSASRLATAAIPGLLSAGLTGWLLASNSWSSVGVEAMEAKTPSATSFADLANITATAKCLADGTDHTVCDPYGRTFQPYVVLPARILAALGLGPDQTGPLGIALAVLYVLTVVGLGLWLAAQWRGSLAGLVAGQVALALGAVTAPAMLAVERGQIELITLALAVGALLALSSQRLLVKIPGAIAGVLAVVSKFFAVGLFAPFVRRGRLNAIALVGLAVSIAYLLLSLSDIQQASAAARADLPATSKSQFGSATLVATLLSDSPIGYVPSQSVSDTWPTVRLAGWAVTAVVVVIMALVVPRSGERALDGSAGARALVIGSTGVLMLPYLLGASHDYRQVFLLPVIAGAVVWLGVTTGAARWLPLAVVLASLVSLATGAAMVPTPSGFIWAKPALVIGDLCLLFVLATGAGLWVRSLVHRGD